MKENCELLIKAKSLAIQRGLDDSKIVCPFLDWCKGQRCHLIDPYEVDFEESVDDARGMV